MKTFLVRMSHPDGAGWGEHLAAHVEFLRALVATGELLASGPLKGTLLRTGFLIMRAEDQVAVEALVAQDPFATNDLIVDLDIDEWDPLFGTFTDLSSGQLPGFGAT